MRHDRRLFPSHWRALFAVFTISFIFNLLWEELHAPLYVSYQGQPITQLVLLHATLADAGFITLFAIFFFNSHLLRDRLWLIIPIGLAIALGIEWWALQTHRWVYAAAMPLLPFSHIGLTPFIQLAITGYGTLLIVGKISTRWQSSVLM